MLLVYVIGLCHWFMSLVYVIGLCYWFILAPYECKLNIE
jgi:hypothetical protein